MQISRKEMIIRTVVIARADCHRVQLSDDATIDITALAKTLSKYKVIRLICRLMYGKTWP
jgi:hypothetical protein